MRTPSTRLIKGFLIVSAYRRDWFYVDNEFKALAIAKSCGFVDPRFKESRWFDYVDQHIALGL